MKFVTCALLATASAIKVEGPLDGTGNKELLDRMQERERVVAELRQRVF